MKRQRYETQFTAIPCQTVGSDEMVREKGYKWNPLRGLWLFHTWEVYMDAKTFCNLKPVN